LFWFYEHNISSLISTFVSSILASFDTWQRKIWLWSAGVSKSVNTDELEKNVESVWLPIELTNETIDQKNEEKKNNTNRWISLSFLYHSNIGFGKTCSLEQLNKTNVPSITGISDDELIRGRDGGARKTITQKKNISAWIELDKSFC